MANAKTKGVRAGFPDLSATEVDEIGIIDAFVISQFKPGSRKPSETLKDVPETRREFFIRRLNEARAKKRREALKEIKQLRKKVGEKK